ncbi:MAG TPA: histidine kinase [Streptosporangiaceae bacterium]|nr:histidine kinase [Streptosporangiaceae bacterium]
MRAEAARRVAYVIGGSSIVLIVSAVVLTYVDRHASLPAGQQGWGFSYAFGDAVNSAVPLVGLVLASRRPANRIGWLFLAAGAGLGLGEFGTAYGLHALIAAPGSLPGGWALLWLSNWVWVIPFAALSFLFLLFPTGRLRSARWRPAAWFVGGCFVLVGITALAIATLGWSRPFNTPGSFLGGPITITFLVALLVSVTAVVVRFARSAGEERLQLKWFAAAATVVVAGLAGTWLSDSAVVSVLSNLAFLCLWVSIGIAVLKYRLYEIDIVISRAVLYGSLAVFITAVYAGLVAGVGTLVGNRRSALLSALAAAVVAVAFQPLRHRAGRLANRVVYGRRATPYEVLSDFSRRVGGAYASEDVLPQMARIVAAGTGADQVVIWLRVGDELHAAASSSGQSADAEPLYVDGDAMPALPGADVSVPVLHQGALLGAISIRMSRAEPLRPAGEHLVTDLASQAGLVLANAGLIEDLRSSRQRLVAAQDEARRRLERNIHDGAQQDLVALSIKLGLAEVTLDEDTAETRQILRQLRANAAGALENIRDLARGIYPPLLADLGLVAALSAQAGKFPFPVTVQADGIGRSSQDAEAAVYFCCLEALQNISKYANATQACVILQAQNGSLRFTTSDDGTGYDSRRTPVGSGLRNMADRLAALGGDLDVRSAPGSGTTVTGRLPFPATSASH